MTRTTTLALALLLSPLAAAARAADLTVTVTDIDNAKGSVRAALYDSEASFGKPPLAKAALKTNAVAGSVSFVVHDLPAGKYAVASFHDENDSGKLTTNALGVPTEGYGFSNDAQGVAGPPKFGQAAFDFDGKTDNTIVIHLNN
ncbi:MAG TPA: DUF2141 domain-containing protein [Stellaceae bacterium]|nr:DUF2141 domain-containing protein [Stellaceae bacterium]